MPDMRLKPIPALTSTLRRFSCFEGGVPIRGLGLTATGRRGNIIDW
jgi:hypothetical protein